MSISKLDIKRASIIKFNLKGEIVEGIVLNKSKLNGNICLVIPFDQEENSSLNSKLTIRNKSLNCKNILTVSYMSIISSEDMISDNDINKIDAIVKRTFKLKY